MGHSESKSEDNEFDPSNIFVLKTLFGPEKMSSRVLHMFKEALILFTVPHGRITTNGLELYGSSFREHQLETPTKLRQIIFKKALELAYENLETQRTRNIYTNSARDCKITTVTDATDYSLLSLTADPRLFKQITKWVTDSRHNKSSLILSITEVDANFKYTHGTLLVITNVSHQRYEYFYLDPHGTPSREKSMLLRSELEQVLPSPVSERFMSDSCPDFQTYAQGGNCAMWVELFMICLLTHPDLVKAPETLEHLLGASPDMNILIYELYSFFLGIALIPNYVDIVMSKQVQDENTTTFMQMLESSLGVENCRSPRLQNLEDCQAVQHCVFFNQECWFKEINTRWNVFTKLMSLYEKFSNEMLLPEYDEYASNIQSSYNPSQAELDASSDVNDPIRFWFKK